MPPSKMPVPGDGTKNILMEKGDVGDESGPIEGQGKMGARAREFRNLRITPLYNRDVQQTTFRVTKLDEAW